MASRQHLRRPVARSLRRNAAALFAVASTAFAGLSCGKDSGTGPDAVGPAAHVTIVSGGTQQGEVGTELPLPLAVRVTDAAGRPVAGQVVNFVVTRGGGHLFAGSGASNADGLVQDRWTLGTVSADSQKVEARAVDATTGAPIVFAVFVATAVPGPPASIAKLSGDLQSGGAGAALADSLAIRVVDRYGNGIAGRAVSFAATSGTVSAASTTSDATGRVAAGWTLGARVDSAQVVTVASGTVPSVTFSATPVLPSTAVLTKSGGDAQQAAVGTTLRDSLAVRVTTADGRPVQGVRIAWSIASGSGTVGPAESVTDAAGYARARWTLGTASREAQRVDARIVDGSGVVRPAQTFTATPQAEAPVSISLASLGGSSFVGMAVFSPGVATVVDRLGNPVSGVTVTWVGEGGLVPPVAQSVTDSLGVARITVTLGPMAGTQALVASFDAAHSARTSLTAMPVAAVRYTTVPDTLRFSRINANLAVTPVGYDQYGNLTPYAYAGPGSFKAIPPLSWRVLDPAVVRVTIANGQTTATTATVTSVGTGRGRIVLSDGPITDTVQVVVTQVAASVDITPDSSILMPDDTVRLSATAKDSNGVAMPAPSITWTSADPATASVDASGLVTAHQFGTTLISARVDNATTSIRVRVLAAFSATRISTTGNSACAIGADAATYCWGSNNYGQLGIGAADTSKHAYPQRIVDDPGFVSVLTVADAACGLTAAGTAYCWGSNQVGSLGVPDPATICNSVLPSPCSPRPIAVAGGHRFLSISAGNTNVCGIADDGETYCWGRNGTGQLGTGSVDAGFGNYLPAAVSGGLRFTSISAGGTLTCGLVASGAAYCWGWNEYYQLGTTAPPACPGSTLKCIATPHLVDGGLRFTSISAGNIHACGLTASGDAYCWGAYNASGGTAVLGTSSQSDHRVPAPVVGGLQFSAIDAGGSTCGLTAAGAAYCWGNGGDGSLGTGSSSNVSVPTRVATSAAFASFDEGSYGGCGVTAAGAAYCWGFGATGAIGNGRADRAALTPQRVLVP